MKLRTRTLTLLGVGAGVYYATLLIMRGFLPADFSPPLYLLAGPLLALVLILASDLSQRARQPTEPELGEPPSRKLAREVRELTRQIEVGARASRDYYENVLLTRLREILAERVSLRTGMDLERTRAVLGNPGLGPGVLRDMELYRLLYTPARGRGPLRVRMLEEALTRIEDWKP